MNTQDNFLSFFHYHRAEDKNKENSTIELTLETISIEKIFAFFHDISLDVLDTSDLVLEYFKEDLHSHNNMWNV